MKLINIVIVGNLIVIGAILRSFLAMHYTPAYVQHDYKILLPRNHYYPAETVESVAYRACCLYTLDD
ncbi:MAG: hypothetical protein WCF90_02335, partial [Methanomicrobiales archaeon]